jgi:hypothetical protein
MSKLRLSGLIAAGLAAGVALAAINTPAKAADMNNISIGEQFSVLFVCDSQEIIEQQLDAVYRDKNFFAADRMLAESKDKNECANIGGVPAIVQEVGKKRDPIVLEGDSDLLIFRAVKVGPNAWAASAKKIGSST